MVDLALPTGPHVCIHTISFNKPSGAFVVVMQPANLASSFDQRVFVRRMAETSYREVKLPDALASVTDAVGCSNAPYVFLNMMKWCDAGHRAATDLGLFRLVLPEGQLERLPNASDPATEPEAISVSAILAVSPDGTELHVIVGLPSVVRLPPKQGYAMAYFLATYATATSIVSIEDELPDVFA